MQGWIKLHRKIVDWEWYDDLPTFKLFIHLLLKANYEDKDWKGQSLEKGTLVTSYRSLSFETGLSEKQIRRALGNMKKSETIDTQSTTRNTLIIVLNYNLYQDTEGTLMADDRTDEGHTKGCIEGNSKDNSKRSKEIKKVRNKEYITTTTIRAKLAEEYSQEDLTQEWMNTGLTIAEYCYLSEHMNVNVLDEYILKVKNYENCQDRFGTILRWSMLDGYYHD